MQINFKKAHQLISTLEAKLHATTTHASQAREVLVEWGQKGEARLRKKTAQALKLVRKKADGFTKALTHLEQNLAKSLDQLSASLEKPTADKAKKPAAKKANKVAAKAAKPAAK
ncbi:MAG: hypothetical protein ACKVY0_21910 [Prosthecobacter sp.]|uniref:hypothetical protein n=1 Tax=Prosthecobacter sp. TaxID=1965333 RepID=UPI0038FF1426